MDVVSEAYEAFAPELRRYATARLRDGAAAEDVVQEAFVRLAIEAQRSRMPDSPQAWLHRVVLNLVVSGTRRAEVARRHAPYLAEDDVVHQSPELQVLASERHLLLGSAMGAAPPDGRACLVLAARGYTGREIAVALGRSEGATRTLMCRTRAFVRRTLANQDPAFRAA